MLLFIGYKIFRLFFVSVFFNAIFWGRGAIYLGVRLMCEHTNMRTRQSMPLVATDVHGATHVRYVCRQLKERDVSRNERFGTVACTSR